MIEVYEVILVDGLRRWHAGWLLEEDSDRLLYDDEGVLVFGSRAGLEHHAQEAGLDLLDDTPDEIDLDLGGWLTGDAPAPATQEISELWHLLLDDPWAGPPLSGERIEEAYDDRVEDEPDFAARHGDVARTALADAVRRLRTVLRPNAGSP